MSEPRYSEAVKITWLLVWRGVLLGLFVQVAVGLIGGFIGKMVGAPKPLLLGLNNLVAMGLWFFWMYPYLVSMIFEKHFKGFRVLVVRYHEVAVPSAAQLRKAA